MSWRWSGAILFAWSVIFNDTKRIVLRSYGFRSEFKIRTDVGAHCKVATIRCRCGSVADVNRKTVWWHLYYVQVSAQFSRISMRESYKKLPSLFISTYQFEMNTSHWTERWFYNLPVDQGSFDFWYISSTRRNICNRVSPPVEGSVRPAYKLSTKLHPVLLLNF